jgi:hypothetical protein
VAACDSVRHVVHGSVAARCDYSLETFVHGASRQRFGVPRMRRDANRQTLHERFNALLPVSNTFDATGEWIKNDNCVGHAKKCLD